MSAVVDPGRPKPSWRPLSHPGSFAKAPSLALLLDYVCTKYFEGRTDQIKEYNVAVEALGRPASFDPRQDSIVRVEAFRLRKRLKQYYENEGSEHASAHRYPVRAIRAAVSGKWPAAAVDESPEAMVDENVELLALPPTVRDSEVATTGPGSCPATAALGALQPHRSALPLAVLAVLALVAAGLFFWRLAGRSSSASSADGSPHRFGSR